MLDSCVVTNAEEKVVRLASIAGSSARQALLDHGFEPDLVDDIAELLDLLGIALSPEELVSDSFRPRDSLSRQFSVGRFGDGTIWSILFGPRRGDVPNGVGVPSLRGIRTRWPVAI